MAGQLVTPSPLPPVKMEQLRPTPSSDVEVGDIPPPEASNDLPPNFVNSVDQLRGLSSALNAFLRRYDELHGHLEFIRTSIDAKSPQPLDSDASLALPLATVPFTGTKSGDVPTNAPAPIETFPITKTQSPNTAANETEATPKTVSPKSTVDESVQINPDKSSLSEVEELCKTSNGKGLRKYMLSHLSEATKLREEVPAALKLSPNPATVVLSGFGRFFLTGIRAYTEGSQLVKGRETSVLLLECFMMMGYDPNEIDDGEKKEAASAAEAWKKRLIGEGGLTKACTMDARGLLLLIGCYGIPSSFDNRDVRELVQGSKPREISDVLRKSQVLMTKIPEIIEEMTKKKMEVEAVNIIYVFGLESKFPPRDILGSFLRDSKETWTQSKKGQSFAAVNKANRKHLADLKSVIKCLQGHKVDPAKLLPGWQIKQKMGSLERDIAEAEKKDAEQGTPSKRKAEEPVSSKHGETQEVKRTRYPDLGRQSPRAVDGGGYPGYLSSFPASAPLPQGVVAVPLSSRPGDYRPYDPYDIPHAAAGLRADRNMRQAIYEDSLLSEGNMRQAIYEDSLRYSRLAGDASSSYRERLIGQSLMDPAARGFSGGDVYRSVPSAEGFAGLRNPSSVGVSNRRPGSDLYTFADTIL